MTRCRVFLVPCRLRPCGRLPTRPMFRTIHATCPAAGRERQAFHATYWGCVLGSFVAMLIGVVTGANVAAVLGRELGWLAAPILGVLSLGIIIANAMNLYCGALSSITVFQTLAPHRHFGRGWRVAISITLLLVATVLAVVMSDQFDKAYAGFLELLMAIMVPWSAINLVDYYLLRHGNYDLPSFFAADGGVYGRFNLRAMLSYLFGLVIQVPFLANELYMGPFAHAFGGGPVMGIRACADRPRICRGHAEHREGENDGVITFSIRILLTVLV